MQCQFMFSRYDETRQLSQFAITTHAEMLYIDTVVAAEDVVTETRLSDGFISDVSTVVRRLCA